jgi:Outer membrane protein beta-barrel domain
LFSIKHILIFLLLAGGSLCLAERRPASSGGGQKNTWGLVYGGFSFSNHRSDGAGDVQGQTGLAFGVGVEHRIMSQISLGIDMLYTQKAYLSQSLTGTSQYNLAYLEFPIFVKYNVSKEFQLKAGPYLAGLMVSADRQVSGTDSAIKGDFANDYGVCFGSWIGFWANPHLAVGVDVRYDMGLANIQNVAQPQSSIKTRTINSMLTLTFNMK